MIRSFIPHLFTLGNLLCGIGAIILSLSGDINSGIILILIAAGLDFFDGLVARLLGVAGDLGKQLDSLADAVSFGVVPGIMMYQFAVENFAPNSTLFENLWVKIPVLLFPLFAIFRLAKFNIDTEQTTGFKGLPTPAATLLVASSVYLASQYPDSVFGTILHRPEGLALLSIGTGLLMVSNVKLIALKFSSFGWMENKLRYTFILVSIATLIALKAFGIPIVIIWYLIFSLFGKR